MKENKYTHQVEQRREAEQLTPYEQELIKKVEKDRDYKQSLYIPIKPNSVDLSIEDLIAHLQENGIGDAKLYNRLYRGEIVYVPPLARGRLERGVSSHRKRLRKVFGCRTDEGDRG